MTRPNTTDDGNDHDHITRRRLLLSGAVAGLGTTAGCLGGGGGDGGGENTETSSGSGGSTGTSGEGGGSTEMNGSGGGTATGNGSATGTAAAEATMLDAASWGGDVETEIVTGILNEYDNSTEGVGVTYQNTPFEEYAQNLQTQFAGGKEPDVFYLIVDDAPRFMRNGALLGLDEYVMEDDDYAFDDILDNLLAPFTYEGTVHGIPKDFTPAGLMYNTDHLEAAGASAPETWSDLRSALEALAGSADVEYPMAVGSQPRNTLVQLIWQNGGRILNEEMTEAVVGSPEATEAMAFLNGLVKDDLAGIYGSDIEATWAGPALGEETVSTTMTGAWVVSTLEQEYSGIYDAVEVGMPVPEGGEKATIVFTTAWAASANSDSPQAAADLVKSLTDKEGMWEWVETGTALPSRQSLLDRDFYDDRPLLSGLGDLAEAGRALTFGPQTATVLDTVMTEAEAVLTGDKNPEDAMKAAERQINNEL
jgi:multiple sugar transport system substrate-binding protein